MSASWETVRDDQWHKGGLVEPGSQDMRTRGATQVDLMVTDGHDGLLAAVGELFSATPRQRCLVHKQRNVMSAIPRREREGVQAELSGMRETREERGGTRQLASMQSQIRSALSGKRYGA